MAAREHRVSRRVLLGAACAVLSLGEGPGHPELRRRLPSSSPRPIDAARGGAQDKLRPGPSTQKWHRNLAAFRRAEAVVDAAASEPDQCRYDALLDTFTAALRRLLRTPAPDLPALSVKIDLTLDHLAWELTGGEACLAALRRDARRLARRSS